MNRSYQTYSRGFRNPALRMLAEAQAQQQMGNQMGGQQMQSPMGQMGQMGQMGGGAPMSEDEDAVNYADDAELNGQQGGMNDYEMSQETPDEAMGGMEDGEGEDMDAMGGAQPFSENGDVDEIVTQIREMCLQGLQVLADNIEDPAYDLLKKMWLMCDKAQTPEEQPQA